MGSVRQSPEGVFQGRVELDGCIDCGEWVQILYYLELSDSMANSPHIVLDLQFVQPDECLVFERSCCVKRSLFEQNRSCCPNRRLWKSDSVFQNMIFGKDVWTSHWIPLDRVSHWMSLGRHCCSTSAMYLVDDKIKGAILVESHEQKQSQICGNVFSPLCLLVSIWGRWRCIHDFVSEIEVSCAHKAHCCVRIAMMIHVLNGSLDLIAYNVPLLSLYSPCVFEDDFNVVKRHGRQRIAGDEGSAISAYTHTRALLSWSFVWFWFRHPILDIDMKTKSGKRRSGVAPRFLTILQWFV